MCTNLMRHSYNINIIWVCGNGEKEAFQINLSVKKFVSKLNEIARSGSVIFMLSFPKSLYVNDTVIYIAYFANKKRKLHWRQWQMNEK